MIAPGLVPNGKRHGPEVSPINKCDEDAFY